MEVVGCPRHLLLPVSCQDNTRISSAGCLGELCAFLTEEELSAVLQQCLLGKSLLYTEDFAAWERAVGASLPFPSESLLAAGLPSPWDSGC